MSSSQIEVILRRFESPDETRVMEKGKFEVVRIGGLTVGRATYEPGWRWSEHVGPTVGARRCTVAHVGLVVSGTATAALEALKDSSDTRLAQRARKMIQSIRAPRLLMGPHHRRCRCGWPIGLGQAPPGESPHRSKH